ncbi:unnamed protein product [Arctia plantaginis]|uniref:Uncharacterized protein n=1 Tax=Arctia plantaginis TaxID=874455 RepID=A0A8S1AL60_ARCPL|nr:unnamed protein product [Arctia plantaginis]
MSQLVPYHLNNSEQDEGLMFATMFDYQTDEYRKPVDLINETISCASAQPDLPGGAAACDGDGNLCESKTSSPADLTYIERL